MTLKVGEQYRALYGSELVWLGITNIALDEEGHGHIQFRVCTGGKLPRWLWMVLDQTTATAEEFVDYIDRGQQRIDLIGTFRKVKEVEVKYR